MKDYNLIIILGATASGKTKLAVQIADELNSEIISADSRQVFKRMDIGTGKDLESYQIGSKSIPYHLIDILEPGERYNVDAFKNDFYVAFDSISQKNKIPILCGGTGMYIHSLLQNQSFTAVPANLDIRAYLEQFTKEELALKLNDFPIEHVKHADVSSKKRLIRALEIAEYLKFNVIESVDRLPLRPIIFGLKNEVEVTRSKIISRLKDRLNNGMIEEVKQLFEEGVTAEQLIFYGLEYKFVSQYLTGILSINELQEKLGIAICQYAKRQNTFFRKMEKDGINIIWLDAESSINLLKQQVLNNVLIK